MKSLAGIDVPEPFREEPVPQVGDYSKLMGEISQTAKSAGVTLVPVSKNLGDGLILNTVDAGPKFGDAQLAGLVRFAPYIVEAELGRTSVTDGSFATLGKFGHLRALHLEGTSVTGAGLSESGTVAAVDVPQPEWDPGDAGLDCSTDLDEEPSSSLSLQHAGTAGIGREANTMNRREFCAITGVAVLGTFWAPKHTRIQTSEERSLDSPQLQTGNGEWTYRVVSDWGQLPAGKMFGGTHGGIATDKAGNLYVSTQSTTGVLVYDRDGKLLKTIANEYPEVHSLVYANENNDEYFYVTVQKGTPKENWLFVKMKTDGTVVQKITAPPEAGFHAPNEWRLTAAVPGPDGSIFIANGYGDSRIFKFDKAGNYRAAYSGKGQADGLCNCSHGLAVDTRYDQPLSAGMRPRKPSSQPLRFRRQVRAQRNVPSCAVPAR